MFDTIGVWCIRIAPSLYKPCCKAVLVKWGSIHNRSFVLKRVHRGVRGHSDVLQGQPQCSAAFVIFQLQVQSKQEGEGLQCYKKETRKGQYYTKKAEVTISMFRTLAYWTVYNVYFLKKKLSEHMKKQWLRQSKSRLQITFWYYIKFLYNNGRWDNTSWDTLSHIRLLHLYIFEYKFRSFCVFHTYRK